MEAEAISLSNKHPLDYSLDWEQLQVSSKALWTDQQPIMNLRKKIEEEQMRGVSISVTIITILVAFLFTYTTTGYAWTATVNNATSCKIKVKVTYGALGSQSKEDYIDPNGTKTFDTGADWYRLKKMDTDV